MDLSVNKTVDARHLKSETGDGAAIEVDVENGARIIRRMTWRLIPFLMLCYFVSWLDRSNISFAALQMNSDLHLSSTEFGFGAGVFFITYCLCEVPSIMLMQRFGPRGYIVRLMVAWGVCAAALAFARGIVGLSALRLLLGAAEAGFYPCVLYFLGAWFPTRYRSRIMALFVTAIPLSGIVGSPLSGYLLSLEGLLGLHGWQWLFLIEGLLAVVLAPAVHHFIQDTPAQAYWLTKEDRTWLMTRLAAEEHQIDGGRRHGLLQAMTHPWILFMGAVYFTNVCLLNSVVFFLPQIVKGFGLSSVQTGFVVTIPSFFALFSLILWARHSDARQERYAHAALANIAGGVALLASALIGDPAFRIVAIAIAYACTIAFVPPFWAIPASFLNGPAVASGIAAISAIGVIGGFLAPWLVGFVRDLTGDYRMAMGSIACLAIVATTPFLLLGRRRHAALAAAADGAAP